MRTESEHIRDVDYLRGVAILLTMIAHINFAMPTIPSWLMALYHVSEYWGGVYLFFVISGFVISRGFSPSFEQGFAQGTARSAWLRFYVRRFFRIVPPALFWIAMTLSFAAAFNADQVFGGMRANITQAIAASVFAYNFIFPHWTASFGIYWSLALEEQFYLFFPFLHIIPRRIRWIVLSAPIFLLFFVHRPAGTLAVFLPVDALAWGVLIAAAQRGAWLPEPTFLADPRKRNVNQIVCLAAIVVIPAQFKALTCATSIMTMVCAWVVFCASFNKGYMRIGGDIVRLIGIVSFSTYLCHMTFFLFTKSVLIRLNIGAHLGVSIEAIIAAALALLLTAIASILSYQLIEAPSRAFGRTVVAPAAG